MAFRGRFLLLSVALIAFSGTKSILAQESATQPKIENTGGKSSLLVAEEPNKSLNVLKEVGEGSLAVDESLNHKINAQEGKIASGNVANNMNINTATGKVAQIKSVKEDILNSTVQGNQDNATSKAKLTHHQIISPENHWNHDHISGRGRAHTYSQPPEVTALLAGIFVAFAVIGYFGLVCWRRALERKYGNREMLVDEEELNSDD